MSTATTGGKKRGKLSPWLVRLGLGLLATLTTTLIVAMLTLIYGGVHGVEFCPQTFQRRAYSFYEIPWIGIQVRAVRHVDLTGPLEKHLVQKKLVQPPGKSPVSWHIVRGVRGAGGAQTGDAEILTQYLDAQDAEEKHVWLDWSEKNPQQASVLWPAIAQLSREDLYVFVPEFIDLAKNSADPIRFRQQLHSRLAETLFLVAQRYQQAENDEAARHFRQEAERLKANQ